MGTKGERPFTLYVPEDPGLDDACVLYLRDGRLFEAGQTVLD